GERLAARADRPDAVFAANDNMAVGALLALQDAGLRVPEDIALVGFDDIPLASLVRPALTTLKINIAETGRRALQRLVDSIQATGEIAADCEVIRPELVVRPSSVAPTSPETRSADDRSLATAGETISKGENLDV
ncbi:MAG TPA: substrate-binding domain-containing protein, partial [Brevundimonas sp.]|nr:substrate-binding domain-containing protein [Brevundimonas sp.]